MLNNSRDNPSEFEHDYQELGHDQVSLAPKAQSFRRGDHFTLVLNLLVRI